MRVHRLWYLTMAFVLFPSAALPAGAQDAGRNGAQNGAETGSIIGRVTDAATSQPLSGVAVEARTPGATRATGRLSNDQGQFRLDGLEPGAYEVTARVVGFAEGRYEGVVVVAGEAATLDIRLTVRAYTLDPVTVSASRKQESLLKAPSTVAVVGLEALEERPTVSPIDHVRAVPGVDLITTGLQSSNVVTRGFNNLFSGALYTLTDHRIASVPSLRVNLLHFVPATNDDLERMEVVLGPGAALYGPNTANGVLHMLTKSPLDEQGTRVSVAGGERDVVQGSFRTAQRLTDDFAVKVSGQYLRGQEWEYIDPAEKIARDEALANPEACRAGWQAGGIAAGEASLRCARTGLRDFDLERWSLDARADWRVTPEWTTVVSTGLTRAGDGIEITGIGAAQARDWSSYYTQARASRGRFFGQVYLNGSDAGDTFLLQNGASIADRSKLFVGQAQHGFAVGERQDFSYGVDYLRTMPETEGTINGANEDDDLLVEVGGYLQSETALSSKLDLILTGRVDHHSALDEVVFSPRAALVFEPVTNQNLRFTYNSAFETPSSLTMFLDIHGGAVPNTALASLGYGMRAQGPGSGGIDLVDAGGVPLGMRSPFNPGGAGQLLPTESSTLWALAVGVMNAQGQIDNGTAAELMALDASGVGINALNPSTLEVSPLGSAGLTDVPGIGASRQTTLEMGYKGLFGNDRVLLAADAWYTEKSDFISPLYGQTPFLLLDGQGTVQMLVPYFMGKGMSQDQATAAALQMVQGDPGVTGDGIAEVPLAVASAQDVNAVGSDMLVSYRNFGEVSLWGADIVATVLLTDRWRVGLSGSYVSDDHFRVDLEGAEQIVALNAPTLKGSTSLGYRDRVSGFNAEARVRYHNAFPANSAGYVGLACVGVAGSPECVDDAVLADVTLGYRLPVVRGATLQLSVQNLFDTPYGSFVRVPQIGRMALLRLTYDF